MALRRINGLISFSDHFEIDEDELTALGAFDPLLDIDLPYAIDAKLLDCSAVPEMAGAYDDVFQRYRDVVRLVEASQTPGDMPWRAAERRIDFPEFKGACLGFSLQSGGGRGWGPVLRANVLSATKQIISLGIRDPRFFELLGVFQDGIGPDLISDMIGTILMDRLCAFTKRVCTTLSVPMNSFTINKKSYELPGYIPQDGQGERYIILLPEDALSQMPVALDRRDVPVVAEHNAATRQYLNLKFGNDWQDYVQNRKDGAQAALLNDVTVFREFIERYEGRSAEAYDFNKDPQNNRVWYALARKFLENNPTPTLSLSANPTQQEVANIVLSIVNVFQRNVEHNGLWAVFYNDDDTPRSEAIVQRTFQAVALRTAKRTTLIYLQRPTPAEDRLTSRYRGDIVVESTLSLSFRGTRI